jgi:hypothetical protein
MSFIYDPKLLADLIQAGSKSLSKRGQANPGETVALQLAPSLITKLQREINPEQFPQADPVSAEGTPAATAADLRTLGDFLQWAAINKVTWQGKRIAFSDGEQLPSDVWELDAYKSDRSRGADRKPQQVSAYANKPELLSYLKYLRDGEATKKPVLRVMLGKIIQEVNQQLEPEEEKIATRARPAPTSAFNPNEIVDVFPAGDLDPAAWQAGLNDFPFLNFDASDQKLTAKDISSQGAFTSWLDKMKMKGAEDTLLSPNGDPCPVIHMLYQRANYLAAQAPSRAAARPNYPKLAAAYKQAIIDFGSKVASPANDNKFCDVTAPTAKGKEQSVVQETSAWFGRPGGRGKSSPGQDQALARVFGTLPFIYDAIDFRRINDFFNQYRQISGNYQGEVDSLISDAREQMRLASGLTSPEGQTSFRLAQNGQEFLTSVKGGRIETANAILGALRKIINDTVSVVFKFAAQYGQSSDPDQKQLLPEQKDLLAEQYKDGGLYTHNKDELQQLQYSLMSMAGIH